jgi:hypothetical protein
MDTSKPNTAVQLPLPLDMRASTVEKTDVLDKVKALALLPDGVHADTKMVAAYYEVSEKTIQSVVGSNRTELLENGYHVLKGDDFRAFATSSPEVANLFSPRARSVALFPRRAILNVGQLLTESPIAEKVRAYLLNVEASATTEQRVTAADTDLTPLQRVRAMGKVDYRTFTDAIVNGSVDYDKDSKKNSFYFGGIRNTIYRAITGLTATEIIQVRQIKTWKGKSGPRKDELKVAANYLDEKELRILNRLARDLCIRAQDIAEDGYSLNMRHWPELVTRELKLAQDRGVIKRGNMPELGK